MTGAQAVVCALQAENVDTVFGYPGGYIMPVFDALYTCQDQLHTVLTRHEQGAAHAAQGYARVSGKVGVVIVTSGPGASNVVTGAADAMLDSTPLVIICGQSGVAQLGSDGFQETDLIGITQPVTKWNYQIRRAEDIPWAMARAFYIAREGRPGPVVLDLSKDAQNQTLDFHYEKCSFIRSYQPYPQPAEGSVETAAEWINAAERPLAIVGQGVQLAHAEQELYAFLEKAGIPAASTMMGLSLMADDYPLNVGMVGMHGNVAPNRKTNECDVLIAIGMRFSDRITGNVNTYARQARIIHMDIDPSEINRNVPVDLPVLGNVKTNLPRLTALLRPAEHKEWLESFKPFEQQEAERVRQKDLFPQQDTLTMAEVVKAVSDASGPEAVCVADVGQNEMVSARYFSASPSRRFVASGGLGTMGFCLPAAVGAAIGCPRAEVYAICGDGGFQMTEQELGTMMQYRLPVKMVILNNSYLGMVRQWQELFWQERYSSTYMQNPDFVTLASAYGIKGRRVSERSQLAGAVAEMVACPGPYLLEVTVEQKGLVFPMIPAGTSISNILMEKPLGGPVDKSKLK